MSRFPTFPDAASTAQVFTRRPDIYEPFNRATEAIMRGPSRLSPGERELIGAFVSSLNACAYCAGGHLAASRAFGVDEALLAALLADEATAPVEARLRPVYSYLRKLTLSPARITDEDAARVFAAGNSEADLHDAIAVCCLFSFMNRLVEGHGIVAIEGQFDERGRRHQSLGYVGQFERLMASVAAAKGP